MDNTTFRLAYIVSLLILVLSISYGSSGQVNMKDKAAVTEPSGTIAFMTTRDGNFEIYAMDAAGGQVRNLTHHSALDYGASFFPDGSMICFFSNREGNNDIFVMNADGTNPVNLTNHPASDRMPCVSPDGMHILFVSSRDEWNDEIYIMDADGANVRRLTFNQAVDDAPFWSPDGSKIIFTRELVDSSAIHPSYLNISGEIFTMNTDGTDEVRLTYRIGYEGFPKFSPDGSQIVFQCVTAEGDRDLFLMDPDGTNVINLTLDIREDHSPSWSPDGQWIAYSSGDAQNYDIWIIHVATRQKRQLTTHPARDEMPVWGK